jgi:hypothetical protein
LRPAEPLDALVRDEYIFFEPDVAASTDGDAQLKREDM